MLQMPANYYSYILFYGQCAKDAYLHILWFQQVTHLVTKLGLTQFII